jgi:hypothetical protein
MHGASDPVEHATPRGVPDLRPSEREEQVRGRLAVHASGFRAYDLAPGERAVVAVAASDREQARLVLGYSTAPFKEQDTLRPLVNRPSA